MQCMKDRSLAELELAHYWRVSLDIQKELAATLPDPTILAELSDELATLRDLSVWASLKLKCLSDVNRMSGEIKIAAARVAEADRHRTAYRARL